MMSVEGGRVKNVSCHPRVNESPRTVHTHQSASLPATAHITNDVSTLKNDTHTRPIRKDGIFREFQSN